MVATALSYFSIFYLYSALCWFVATLNPAIHIYYFLYFLIATLPFFLAMNRLAIGVFRIHWPVISLFAFYFLFISIQFALFGMSENQPVRDAYFAKAEFFSAILFSLMFLELSLNFRNLLAALYLVVLWSCAVNIVEFFYPTIFTIQLSTVLGRAAGFYLNPNISATFIVSPIPLLCGRQRTATRLLFYGVTGIGTFLTFSRGGWALWFAAVFITEMAKVDWKTVRLDPRNIGVIAGVLIGIIGLVVAFQPTLSFITRELGSNLDPNTSTRLELLANDTTMSRLEIARQGLIAFSTAPIFGHGVGYTWQWEYGLSVHDMFVLILAEQGIVGFIWLMALLLVWWRYPRPYGWWLVVIFGVAAFTTHNYFDGPIPAILIVFYLVAAHRFGKKRSYVPTGKSRVGAPLARQTF